MNQSLFKQDFVDAIERNFTFNAKYLEYENKIFHEFRSTIHEIGKCLILKLNYATITLTNHLLERLLKLALIEKAVGLGPKPIQKLNEFYAIPVEKYGSLPLGNSIELCKKESLIDLEEKEFLFDFVREMFRNGFSHGDAQKVLSTMADDTPYFRANASDTVWEEITLNPKIIPQLQAAHMESFANENASFYFDYVFQLMQKIETRLINFEKVRTI